MAFTIPETLSQGYGQQAELFRILKRQLSEDIALWHSSALELDDSTRVDYLAMGEEIGVATIYVADSNTDKEIDDYLRAIESRSKTLVTLLGEAYPELVEQGAIRPKVHVVAILPRWNRSDLKTLQIQHASREILILGDHDLDQLEAILKSATPISRQLDRQTEDLVRSIVAPSIQIKIRRRSSMAEGNLQQDVTAANQQRSVMLLDLKQEQVVKSSLELPEEYTNLPRDLDTRLVRGVAGSGKSLILLHRAKHLANINPHWKIFLATYNKSLADFLKTKYNIVSESSGNVRIQNFHAWCAEVMRPIGAWPSTILGSSEYQRKGVLVRAAMRANIILEGDEHKFLLDELDWIRDVGVRSWEQYKDIERKGRQTRLPTKMRERVWNLLNAYRSELRDLGQADWSDIPLRLLELIESGRIADSQFHAILIDEAQDFGLIWFQILQKMLVPTTNQLFIVADGAQKLYQRPLSWRALGIDVKGNRSRLLSRSYRNTYEILRVANELLRGDGTVAESLRSEADELIPPDMNERMMRHGALPIIWCVPRQQREVEMIVEELLRLKQSGYDWSEFGILAKDNVTLTNLAAQLQQKKIPVQLSKGSDIDMSADKVKLLTLHASKGLEFGVVFVASANTIQPRPGLSAEELKEELLTERRLLYVAMTRARDRLYILYQNSLPDWAHQILSLSERRP